MAKRPFVFDTTKCDVDPVTRIPCENMLLNPGVPDAPPDIPDCDQTDIPPLPGEPPCPTLSSLDTNKFVYGGTYADNPPELVFKITQGKCCDFYFDVELDIPCATLNPTTPTVKEVGYGSGSQGTLTYYFVTHTDTCTFDLDIDLDFPCADIGPTDLVVKDLPFVGGSQGLLAYQFVKGEDCSFDLDIDIELPCGSVGPTAVTAKATSYSEGNQGVLTYQFVKGDDCSFDLDVDLELPCAAVGPTDPTVKALTYAEGSQGSLTYQFTAGGDCTFDLDVDVELPCGNVGPTDPTVKPMTFTPGSQGSLTYYFTKTDGCAFDLNIDVEFPCASVGPVTPTTQAVAYTSGTQGELTYFFTPSEGCSFDLVIDLNLPCAPVGPTSPVTKAIAGQPGSQGSLTYYFTASGDCTFDFNIDVVTPCSDVGPLSPTVIALPYAEGSQGSLTYYFTTTGGCDFDLTIDAELPCPDIGPTALQVVPMTQVPSAPEIRYQFTKGDDCSYDLSVEADYLCASLGPTTPTYAYGPGAQGRQSYVAYHFEPGPDCVYDLTLEFNVPCPVSVGPPTPVTKPVVFSSTGSQGSQGSQGNQGTLTYYFVDTDDGGVDLDIDLEVPLPTFDSEVSASVTTIDSSSTASATVTLHQVGQHLFWSFAFNLPRGFQGLPGPQGPQGPPGSGGGGGGSGTCADFASLHTEDCILAVCSNGEFVNLTNDGSGWVSDEQITYYFAVGPSGVPINTYKSNLRFYWDGKTFQLATTHLTNYGTAEKLLYNCGNGCFVGGPATGHLPKDGFPGYQGYQGSQGYQGYPGYQGTQGLACNGDSFAICLSCQPCPTITSPCFVGSNWPKRLYLQTSNLGRCNGIWPLDYTGVVDGYVTYDYYGPVNAGEAVQLGGTGEGWRLQLDPEFCTWDLVVYNGENYGGMVGPFDPRGYAQHFQTGLGLQYFTPDPFNLFLTGEYEPPGPAAPFNNAYADADLPVYGYSGLATITAEEPAPPLPSDFGCYPGVCGDPGVPQEILATVTNKNSHASEDFIIFALNDSFFLTCHDMGGGNHVYFVDSDHGMINPADHVGFVWLGVYGQWTGTAYVPYLYGIGTGTVADDGWSCDPIGASFAVHGSGAATCRITISGVGSGNTGSGAGAASGCAAGNCGDSDVSPTLTATVSSATGTYMMLPSSWTMACNNEPGGQHYWQSSSLVEDGPLAGTVQMLSSGSTPTLSFPNDVEASPDPGWSCYPFAATYTIDDGQGNSCEIAVTG